MNWLQALLAVNELLHAEDDSTKELSLLFNSGTLSDVISSRTLK